MSQNSTYQNYSLVSKEADGSHVYYGRKSGKGEKATVSLKCRKYHKGLRKHVVFTQKKIVWRAN